MKKTPPILIMRGNDICYLGILRSCYEASIPCISIQFTWPGAPVWYSEFSCYQPEKIVISNPFTDAIKAVSQLKSELERLYAEWGQKLMLVVSSDTNYMFILDNYEYFSNYIILMGDIAFENPRNDVIHKASCAQLLSNSAPELVPKTYRCSVFEDIDKIINIVEFPVIYKPAVKDYGQTFYSTHNGNKAIECMNSIELKMRLTEEIQNGFDLIVQEKIEFDSVYDEVPFYLYANKNGKIIMAANGIKEIIEPFPFGTAIALRFAWYPELLELAEKVVQALQYRGILMIEFVKDKKDDQWKVIEVNPRHWLFNGFYQRLGLNFTNELYLDLYSSNNIPMLLSCPSGELIAKNHVHIDIGAIAKHFSSQTKKSEYDIDEFLMGLSGIEGNVSVVHMDQSDHSPGEKRLSDLASEYRWDEKKLIKQVRRIIAI